MNDTAIRRRWTMRLHLRQAQLRHAQKQVRYWLKKRDKARNPSPQRRHARHMLADRRATVKARQKQVELARRVINRHTPHKGISADAIRHVAPWLTGPDAKRVADALGPAFAKYHINTPTRAAAAVAQFCHESAGFRTTTEFASGAEYEGRHDLGNTHPGDGVRFKGRGYVQVTGRSNYAAVSRAMGHDFLSDPFALAQPRWAAMASCWWWENHGCNQLADSGDFVALTRRINGGTNGLSDREAYWARAKAVADRLVPH